MKIGTLRKSSALLVCAMAAIGAAAIAADTNTETLGLHEARTPAITLNAKAESSTASAMGVAKKTSNYASSCTAGCACASCAGTAKLNANLSGVDKSDFQKAFLITNEDTGTVFLMGVKRNGSVGGLTKMKATTDLAPPTKKSLMVDAKTHGGGSGGVKYDTAHDGSSDKVRGTGQQYGADMAHRSGVVVLASERPDTSA